MSAPCGGSVAGVRCPFQAGHDGACVTGRVTWAEGDASSEVNAIALNQLRRDRDELVEALRRFVEWPSLYDAGTLAAKMPFLIDHCRALLARVRASRPASP